MRGPGQIAGHQINTDGQKHQKHNGQKTPVAVGAVPIRNADIADFLIGFGRVLVFIFMLGHSVISFQKVYETKLGAGSLKTSPIHQ
jgi:hypothetical protein